MTKRQDPTLRSADAAPGATELAQAMGAAMWADWYTADRVRFSRLAIEQPRMFLRILGAAIPGDVDRQAAFIRALSPEAQAALLAAMDDQDERQAAAAAPRH